MEWAITTAIAVIGCAILVWRFVRERRNDRLVQWVAAAASSPTGITVTLKPIGDGVRDVRISVAVIGTPMIHAPVAVAEWPSETPTMDLDFDGMPAEHIGAMWVQIIYRPSSQPTLRHEEWEPLDPFGTAAEAAHQQEARRAPRTLWLRATGAPVGPGAAQQRKRRLTARIARREVRQRTT